MINSPCFDQILCLENGHPVRRNAHNRKHTNLPAATSTTETVVTKTILLDWVGYTNISQSHGSAHDLLWSRGGRLMRRFMLSHGVHVRFFSCHWFPPPPMTPQLAPWCVEARSLDLPGLLPSRQFASLRFGAGHMNLPVTSSHRSGRLTAIWRTRPASPGLHPRRPIDACCGQRTCFKQFMKDFPDQAKSFRLRDVALVFKGRRRPRYSASLCASLALGVFMYERSQCWAQAVAPPRM